MKFLDEKIARRANKETKTSGRFWEGRFGCNRLDDEGAVLACMVYVDLNPIRAKLADKPEEQQHTSIRERVRAHVGRRKIAELEIAEGSVPAEPPSAVDGVGSSAMVSQDPAMAALSAQPSATEHATAAAIAPTESIATATREQTAADPTGDEIRASSSRKTRADMILEAQADSVRDYWLMPLTGDNNKVLSIPLESYIAIVDWTGRCIAHGKEGRIPEELAPILERMDLNLDNWIDNVLGFRGLFYRVCGKLNHLVESALKTGLHWLKGRKGCKLVFCDA